MNVDDAVYIVGVPSLHNLCILAAISGLQDLSVYSSSSDSIPHKLWKQVVAAFEAQKRHTLIRPKLVFTLPKL